jgi:hypothetical protein
MLFDRPAPLPVATARSRSHVATFASRARGGWLWLRPRTVPLIVALAGMFAVLGAAEYLSRLARYTPQTTQVTVADPPARLIVIPADH